MTPLVSISVTAYNHAAFLEACLDGILMQRCDFAYEVLLGEDESSDGTRAIAQRYAAAHPDRIKLFLHRRKDVIHIDGRPTGRNNLLNNLRHARGRYVCQIDGDDAWTDPDRLRIMVEKMEAEPELGLAFHNAVNRWPDGDSQLYLDPGLAKPRFSQRELTDTNFIPTSGVIWRWNGITRLPERLTEILMIAPFADWVLNIHFAGCGPIGYVDQVMSVRNVHAQGAMAAMDRVTQFRTKALAHEVIYKQVDGQVVPGALKRWEWLLRRGFEMALAAGETGHASWFIRHAKNLQGHSISARERWRWLMLLHFPKLMGLYSTARGQVSAH